MRDVDDNMSMDDILASIRRYVSDDEQKNDRVIQLTKDQEIHKSQQESISAPQKDFSYKTNSIRKPEPIPQNHKDPIQESAKALSRIQNTTAKFNPHPTPEPNSSPNHSIEEFLASIIKDWLDKNMPEIVAQTVQKEIDRIRKAM